MVSLNQAQTCFCKKKRFYSEL